MACDNDPNSVCKSTTGPFDLDDNGNPISIVPGDTSQDGCKLKPGTEGPDALPLFCPDTPSPDQTCNEFQLSENRDACYIDMIGNEALNRGGAVLNVYKLLGVHEQGKLIDVTGQGVAISNGDAPGYPAANAFDAYITEWHSIQIGDAVLPSAYIGYDFGEIKTNDDSRRMYGIDTSVNKHITAFQIKQSADPDRRATQVRLEWSANGRLWRGAGIAPLPNDDCLNLILMKESVPARYWRLRPTAFTGGDTDNWGVQALAMFHDYVATDEYNIQDKIFLENRDRDYADSELILKGYYDLLETQTELQRFGIEMPGQTYYISVNFSACVAILGRPLVIGDIIEMPSEAMYSAQMRRIMKWVEVTDVTWSSEGFTPGWQPTILRVLCQPAYASQETQDIFGDLAEELVDDTGLVDGFDGNNPVYQDYADVSHTVEAMEQTNLPERGAEGSSHIREWEQSELDAASDQGLDSLQSIGLNSTGLYVEDAMPPNNAPFTESDEYPTSPAHGVYHRLTYSGLSKDVPARLYRYSTEKGRWIYLETDKRYLHNPDKPFLQEYLTSSTRVSITDTSKDNS